MKRILSLVVVSLLTFAASAGAQDAEVIGWYDLVPPDWNPNSVFDEYSDDDLASMSDDLYFELQRKAEAILDAAPTVPELDGRNVKVPGFLLPLEFDETKIKEFLLVPYFGACVHTPPPPANQIIHGVLDTQFTMSSLWEPVWISGKISTTRSQQTLGEAGVQLTLDIETGYTMEVDLVEPYQE
ncbi:MAG: DUF3299 domain-containing protein [Pseudomonadota bacterium]